MLSPLTLFFPCCSPHPSDYLPSCYPLLLSSLLLLFYLTITCVSSPPLIVLTRSYHLMLFLFSLFNPTFFHLSPSSPLFFFTLCLPSLLPLLLSHFLPSSLLLHHFPFPLLLLMGLGSVHQAYWLRLVVDEFRHDYTHTRTHRHMRMSVHRPVGDGG